MTFAYFDRVKESSTTTGTGNISLGGAVTAFRTFSSVYSNGDTMYYTITDQNGSNWEVGLGTYVSSGNQLARTTVTASSNSGSLVNFTSAALYVFTTIAAKNLATSLSVLAWVNFNATGGTISIRASSPNISGVTRNSIGKYTIGFSPALPSANYSILGTTSANYSSNAIGILTVNTTGTGGGTSEAAPTTSACVVTVWDGGGSQYDPKYVNITIVGS